MCAVNKYCMLVLILFFTYVHSMQYPPACDERRESVHWKECFAENFVMLQRDLRNLYNDKSFLKRNPLRYMSSLTVEAQKGLLIKALAGDCMRVVCFLIAKNPTFLQIPLDEDNNYLLHKVVVKVSLSEEVAADILSRSSIDINAKNKYHASAFHLLMQKSYVPARIGSLFLEHGALPNELGWAECTPLFYAVESMNTEAVRVLLSYPVVEPNIPTSQGETPLKKVLEKLSYSPGHPEWEKIRDMLQARIEANERLPH